SIRAKLLLGQPERALALYREVMKGRGDAESLLSALADDFGRARQAVAAYRASPDKREAFRLLSGSLLPTDSGQLLDLLREQGGAQAPDRAVRVAWARLYMRRKDPAQSLASSRLAQQAPDDGTGQPTPNEIDEASVAIGRAKDADRAEPQPG